MNKVYCQVDDCFADPLFEVFDGGDFVLSSYHDVEASGTEVRIFLPEGGDVGAAKAYLSGALEVIGCSAPVEVAQVPDEDWRLSYRRHFKTEKVGRSLVTVPTWELDDFRRSDDPDMRRRVPVVLDPGLAFGTGRHETTRACLEYIDELRNGEGESAGGCSFLDMGCGSGILSIAAAKLGYSPVAGFDIDEDAVHSAQENAAANGVVADFRLFALGGGAVTLDASVEAAKGIYPDLALQNSAKPSERIFNPAELVVANILGPLLVAFAEEIASYARRDLVLSGMLNETWPEVCGAFAALGFAEVSRKSYGEWTTALMRRGDC
ncbi:MAG: 50S ribosomal protein L11 methyltransferase [Kiritimatiellae bacterium]|nr:50S ribosomal protein L11 methyltransferase [Kiritimatiellia bacterium]